MESRKRVRKTEIVKKPPDLLMTAGGEGVISKEDLRIKVRSFPQLADFKTRSYLNFTASIPLRFNRITGYYEPAEIGDIVTSHTHGYYYPTEPTTLVDAGWYDGRINKRKHRMSALYDEDGTHLKFLPYATYKGLLIGGKKTVEGYSDYYTLKVDGEGHLYCKNMPERTSWSLLWDNVAVPAGASTPIISFTYKSTLCIMLKSSVANTAIVEHEYTLGRWYALYDIELFADKPKADVIEGSFKNIRIKVTTASTMFCEVYWCEHG